MKFSYLAVFPPGNSAGILGKTVGGSRKGEGFPLSCYYEAVRLSSNQNVGESALFHSFSFNFTQENRRLIRFISGGFYNASIS